MKKIIIDPTICNGKPIFSGTRITVQTILEFLAAGDSVADVVEEYPSLQEEDVLAALGYAAKLLANNVHFKNVA